MTVSSKFSQKGKSGFRKNQLLPSKAFQEELGIPGVQYHCYEEGDFEKEACDVADLIQTLSAEYPGKNIAIWPEPNGIYSKS